MLNLFKRKPTPEEPKKISSLSNLQFTPGQIEEMENKKLINIEGAISATFQRTVEQFIVKMPGTAMDSGNSIKPQLNNQQAVNDLLLSWYGNQGFIGYQACAIMYQHWLIEKMCNLPAEDATRNGYEITSNDGEDISEDVIDEIRNLDKEYGINDKLIEFISLGRMFGIRIAMFKVESDDPDFYFKPFNIDGVKPGSYKGIAQIDPYWVTAQLDGDAAGNPASIHFYEPTWWKIGTQLVHRTHLIIFRNGVLPDILKPTYYWGGIPVPQKIYENVYNACRGGNELLGLMVTKRTDVMYLDTALATGNPADVIRTLNTFVQLRDNYGVKVLGLSEKMERFDTTLSDADQVTMTLFQLVAATDIIPVTKLLGNMPKGFNATGESDESNYHEGLKSIQTHKASPFLERHHLLLIHSEIAPKFGIAPFKTTIEWKPLDEMTAKELAEVNQIKAATGTTLVQSGAISPQEERERITKDPSSGYNGLDSENITIIESEEQE